MTASRGPSSGASKIVSEVLRQYADRGIFQGYGERTARTGSIEYYFRWHAPEPHRLVYQPEQSRLIFPDLLPEVPYRSRIDRDLRKWIRDRFSPSLPEHRRLDPERISVSIHNHKASLSLSLSFEPHNALYACRKAVKLVNEIFLGFLSGPYEDYMVKTFGAPEE